MNRVLCMVWSCVHVHNEQSMLTVDSVECVVCSLGRASLGVRRVR